MVGRRPDQPLGNHGTQSGSGPEFLGLLNPLPATMVARVTNRRSFLQQVGCLSLAGVAGCASGNTHGGIIDTHTHFYDTRRPEGVPWPSKDDPILYRPVLPGEYRRLAEPLGVRGTLVVEASGWVEDNQWILDLVESDPFLVGLIGNLPVGSTSFDAAWQRYRKNRWFRGIRIQGAQVTAALQPSLTQDHLRELEREGLTLDVLIGMEQLPEIARLADRFRSLRLVVDHCANVPMGPSPHPRPWVSGLAACHYAPNVSMKVSGLVEGTGKSNGDAPRESSVYRPVLDTLWHVLGEDRLLYGSNWPVSSRFASFATVQGIVEEYFRELGPTASANYFRRNAQRIYGIRSRL